MMPVSIIIPTCNRSTPLREALQSVINQDFPHADYETLVVDNASTDATPAVVEDAIQTYRTHTIRYIHEAVPGSTPARHRGAAESKGSVLIFIDDDIEADRNWLAAIHDAFRDPSVHLVGGRSLPNYEAAPPAWFGQIWTRGPDHEYCTFFSLLDLGEKRRVIDANFVWGLNFSIRRETFYRLGGFHPDIVPRHYQRYQGDGETGITIKANEQGLKVIYEPAALVRHLVPAERMTMEYLEKREYFRGVCNSYTSIRKTRNLGFTITTTLFPVTELEILDYRMKSAFMHGYNYHQNEAKNDPRLMEWILRDNYFDYRYPE